MASYNTWVIFTVNSIAIYETLGGSALVLSGIDILQMVRYLICNIAV